MLPALDLVTENSYCHRSLRFLHLENEVSNAIIKYFSFKLFLLIFFYFYLAVYRCSLLIQEPFSPSLENRNSEDFENLSERFISAIERVYQLTSGTQTAIVQTFEYVSHLSLLTKTFFNPTMGSFITFFPLNPSNLDCHFSFFT